MVRLTKADREYLALLWRNVVWPGHYPLENLHHIGAKLNRRGGGNFNTKDLHDYFHNTLMKYFPNDTE